MIILKKILIGFIWIVIFLALIVLELCIIPDNVLIWLSNHLHILWDMIFLCGPGILAAVVCYYIAPYILKKPKVDKD